jgi:HEAT repeat protein
MRTISLLACLSVLGTVEAAAQVTRDVDLRPLPLEERLSAEETISATLRLSVARVAVGETPRFTLRVRNVARRPIFLNPFVISNLRVFSSSGQLVEAPFHGIADYIGSRVQPSDLIRLTPRQAHEFDVVAEYHPSSDFSAIAAYRRDGANGRMRLSPGRYSVRFTYINYPDYGATLYDVYKVPDDVWEGRIETPPVSLTVTPLNERQIRSAVAQIDGAGSATDAIDLVRVGRVEGALEPLFRRFERSSPDRQEVMEAIHDLGGERSLSRLLSLISALPARERQLVVPSHAFAMVARTAGGCDIVPLLLETTTRGDMDALLGDSIPFIAKSCPGFSERLREILQAPLSMAPGILTQAAYQRSGIAKMLGRVGNAADVPLLISVLKRELPNPSPAARVDPIVQAAAHALGRIGGEESGQALIAALADPRNSAIMQGILDEVVRTRPIGAVPAVSKLLTSTDPLIVARAIYSLEQLNAAAAVPQMLPLLKHPDPRVRGFASRTLPLLSPGTLMSEMLSIADDQDPGVRSNALAYLAQYGDSSVLPRFVAAIESADRGVGAAAVRGIDRFGMAATFVSLRGALDRASAENAQLITRALNFLTFMPIWARDATAEWDAWWQTHSQSTRGQWAEEAIDRASQSDPDDTLANYAVQYLAQSNGQSTRAIDQAASSRHWWVRSAAVEAIAVNDPRRAAALLLPELGNRQLGACRNAVELLGKMANRPVDVDCTVAADRQRALDQWRGLAAASAQ